MKEAMSQGKVTMQMDDELLNAEKWFLDTYEKNERSLERIQILMLYKLHQLESRLDALEHQTKMHWTN